MIKLYKNNRIGKWALSVVNKNPKKMNKTEKIINLLLNILIGIFGVILLVSIYTGIQTKIMKNKYTDFFGYSIFEVQTGSMEKAISAGDWIITKITKNVKLDDVITYETDGEYVTHRIIEVYNGTYVTKGDANNTKDDPIDQSQIVGKEVAVLAGFGILRKTLFNPAVLITLIITLFLFSLVTKKNKEEDLKNAGKQKSGTANEILELLESKLMPFVKHLAKFVRKIHKIISKNKSAKKTKENTTTVESKVVEVPNVIDRNKDKEIETIIDTIETPKVADYDSKQKEIEKEEELGKTSFFRVVSVSDDVDDKYKPKEEVIEEAVEEQQAPLDIETDLDKTILYRNIAVDISELNGKETLASVITNNINDKKQINPNPIKVEEEDEPFIEEETGLTKISLNFLKDKRGNRNIIDTAMLIKKEEINMLVKLLVDTTKVRVSEAGIRNKIKNTFAINYIDAKYYNYYEESNDEANTKSLMIKLERTINRVANGLIKKYDGNNPRYGDIVNEYARIFILLANLEKAKDSTSEASLRNELYRKLLTRYSKDFDQYKVDILVKQINSLYKKHDEVLKKFIEKLETNLFNLSVDKISTKGNPALTTGS
jgi:signal peptidase